jgi:transcriptional regulator with XRE-family HTH domain
MSANKEIFKINLGNNIRKCRFEMGLTVEQLALNSGLTYSQVSRIELGKISTSAFAIFIISKTLNVSLDVLFEMPNKDTKIK